MRKFIFGTDWWSDCDDVVAMRLLARAAKRKEIQLLGVGINACMSYSVASLKGFLCAEDFEENVPIGIDLAATDYGGPALYQKRLTDNYCPQATNADAMDAARLYRKLLAEADTPVEIIEVGFLQVMAEVLQSEGDDISPLSGLELVHEKVAKIWVMAGKWDADGERENNFCRNLRASIAAEAFCRLCPVPITFLGWEVGINVLSGGELAESDPLHQVLVDHGSGKGRHSWDPMLTLLALIGDEEKAGYRSVCGTATVDASNGANYFVQDPNGLHKYVVKVQPDDYYKNAINDLISSKL